MQDRHAEARAVPVVDRLRDDDGWKLISAKEENGFTIVKFWRLLDTGDTSQDLVIPRVSKAVHNTYYINRVF